MQMSMWKLRSQVARPRPTSVGALGLALALVPAVALADPGKVADILRTKGTSGLAQNAGLDDATKARLEASAKDTASKTGGKVYVVVLKKDTPTGPYGDVYTQLGMSGKDILLATNGVQWDLRSGNLPSQARSEILETTAKGGGTPLDRVDNVLRETATQLAQVKTGTAGTLATTGPKEVPLARKESSNVGLIAVVAIAAVAVGIWVYFRRKTRDAAIATELQQALKGPESVLTDIYLGMDGMENHPQFADLIERANQVQARLDEVKNGTPSRESIAKLRAIHDDANRVRRAFDEARMLR